jgi:hypothetical protein
MRAKAGARPSRPPSVHDVATSPGDIDIDVEVESASPVEFVAPIAPALPPLVVAKVDAEAVGAAETKETNENGDQEPVDESEAVTVGAPKVSLEPVYALVAPAAPAPQIEASAEGASPAEPPPVVSTSEASEAGDGEKSATPTIPDPVEASAPIPTPAVSRHSKLLSNDFPTPSSPFEAALAVMPQGTSAPAAVALPLLSVEAPRKRSLPPPSPSMRAAMAPALLKVSVLTDSASVDAGWDAEEIGENASEELTRQLPNIVPSRFENTFSDVDVTSPLPPPAAAPRPYGSDTDLTRPMPPDVDAVNLRPTSGPAFAPSRRPVPSIPPLRPVPTIAPPPPAPAPVIVAVPPPSVGEMEHPPSVQISSHASRRSSTPPPPGLARRHSPLPPPPGPPPRRSAPPPPPTGYGRDDTYETMPRIPPPAPVPSEFGARPMRSSTSPVTGSVPPPPLGIQRRWMFALAAVTFGVGALALALRPRTGSLIVTVAGADGAPVRGVSIRVDGKERCTASPCRLNDLPTGAHLISASATGLPPSAERAVAVEAGEPAAEHVTLMGARRAERSGLGVSAIGEGLRVLVDGRDLGAPPVSLRDVEPGAHTVRVLGAAGLYEPYEETVKLDGGEVRSLGPVRLRLLKGRLKLSAGEGANGAKIAVDGHPVPELPATLDLSPDESHEITATRRGFSDLSEQVVFDGTAERRVTVALALASGASPQYAASGPAANTPPRSRGSVRKAASVAAPAPATGVATLDINSSPRTNVVVNGRPLGATPLTGVQVSPGAQTIVFIHPTLGRKIASASVAAGRHGSAFMKF